MFYKLALKLVLCIMPMIILFFTQLQISVSSADNLRTVVRKLPLELEVSVRDNQVIASVSLTNRLNRALCIDDRYIPGANEATEGPTEIFDTHNREVDRIRDEDVFSIYPEGVEGRVVLIIPPGKKWRTEYDLSLIFQLKRHENYYVRVVTFGLICSVYENGLPHEVIKDKETSAKYYVMVSSEKEKFSF